MMGKIWKSLSIPQQTILLAFYGLDLPSEDHLAAWAMLNGHMEHDELGFPTKIDRIEYSPKEYDTLVGLIGRRSGKSYIMCFIDLYEIIFGGHMNEQFIEPGQEVIVPYIAQDLPTARANMKTIALLAKKVPMLAKQITKQTADVIEFWDGRLKVQIEPPHIKTGRGWAMPIVNMDEVGFWYKTSESANPDYEVQRAVSASQLQFPNRKQVIISSPYTEEGLLFDYFKAGTNGIKIEDQEERQQYEGVLVVCAPTACMDNPKLRGNLKRTLIREKLRDPDGFAREYLAKFVTSISGFLSPDIVIPCIEKSVSERKKVDILKSGWNMSFVAAMDPAFRHDSFAFSIFHRQQDGTVVQDVLKVWTPDKKNDIKLDPAEIMDEIGLLVKAWGVSLVYSDQYQLESLQQLALQRGFSIVGHDFTAGSKAKMYGSLKGLLRTQKIKLLDIPVIYQQLTRIQKKLTPMGGIQISAPPGAHDDVASVIALGTEMSIQLYPSKQVEKKSDDMWDLCMKDIKRKRAIAEENNQWA